MPNSERDLRAIHDLLVEVAREAGRMIMAAKPSLDAAGTKNNSADLVTETDKAVEVMVAGRLRGAYPEFAFIGEETWRPGMELTDEPTFIVDPIDGTTNFIHSFPAFCISLGFVHKKLPTIGVILNPYHDDLYTGILNHGSFLTRHSGPPHRLPLRTPSSLGDLSTLLVATEWGSDRSGPNYALKTRVFAQLAASEEDGGAMVHSLRSMGSAALNLAAVAAGSVDVYWEGGCWAWDVVAGWCILVEAGGIMVGGNPGVWRPEVDDRVYLAVRGVGDGEGQKECVEKFWEVVGEGNKLVYEK